MKKYLQLKTQALLQQNEKVDLYDAIDKLRDKYKMVIILKYFNDMTDEQISNNMDIPINTVKKSFKKS